MHMVQEGRLVLAGICAPVRIAPTENIAALAKSLRSDPTDSHEYQVALEALHKFWAEVNETGTRMGVCQPLVTTFLLAYATHLASTLR